MLSVKFPVAQKDCLWSVYIAEFFFKMDAKMTSFWEVNRWFNTTTTQGAHYLHHVTLCHDLSSVIFHLMHVQNYFQIEGHLCLQNAKEEINTVYELKAWKIYISQFFANGLSPASLSFRKQFVPHVYSNHNQDKLKHFIYQIRKFTFYLIAVSRFSFKISVIFRYVL